MIDGIWVRSLILFLAQQKKKKSVWLETSASVWKTTEVGEVSQEPERRL